MILTERPRISILIGGTAVLAVLLFFAPRTPEGPDSENEDDPLQDRIDRAVSIVENGERPMKGIMELRSIAEENPEVAEVQWQLGRFSIRSGQYEKAKERFEKVISIDPRTYQDAYLYLGKTMATLGDTASAIDRLKEFRERVRSDSLREQVDGLLRSLSRDRNGTDSTEQTILNDAKR